jgi:hypothetical protein
MIEVDASLWERCWLDRCTHATVGREQPLHAFDVGFGAQGRLVRGVPPSLGVVALSRVDGLIAADTVASLIPPPIVLSIVR